MYLLPVIRAAGAESPSCWVIPVQPECPFHTVLVLLVRACLRGLEQEDSEDSWDFRGAVLSHAP